MLSYINCNLLWQYLIYFVPPLILATHWYKQRYSIQRQKVKWFWFTFVKITLFCHISRKWQIIIFSFNYTTYFIQYLLRQHKNLPFCAFLTKQLPILICYNAADVVAAKVNSWPLYFPTAQFLTDLKGKRSSFYQSHTMKVWELFKATTVLKSISIINIDTKQLKCVYTFEPTP